MKLLSTLCAIGAMLACSSAMADGPHLTYRLEPGIATSLNEPQSSLYGPGGAITGKVDVNLTKWFDVYPTVSLVTLSSNSGYGVGGTEALGLGARIHRSHDVPRESYWREASPWIDGDLDYFNTGGLNRLGASVGVGVAFPFNEETRHLWMGPFARMMDITDGTSVGGHSGSFNRNDERIFIVGLSFELDPAGRKVSRPCTSCEPTPAKDVPEVVAKVEPTPEADTPAIAVEQTETSETKIHFDFDSAVIRKEDKDTLDEIAAGIQQHLTVNPNDPQQMVLKHVQVDGHASSENHPWAEKHNQTLSERRAQAVVDYLVSKGAPASILSAKGFGTGTPGSDNKTQKGREANRRVEFEITISYLIQKGDGK